METGRVVAWLKQPGEAFKRGETLVEIESDKTVVELPALADGVLTEILANAGADVDVGADLCRYSGAEQAASEPVAPEPVAAEQVARVEPPPSVAASTSVAATGRQRATPVARRLAAQRGVSLDGMAGTGRRGRIEARDIPGDANGRMFTRVWPGGLPLATLLLHGFAGDGQAWEPLASLLARTGGVMAADLPGHGETTLAAPDVVALVDAVVALLRTLPGPVHVIGHSLGGAVAARAARAEPTKVSRLSLIAPAGLDTAIDAEFVGGMAAGRSGGGLAHLVRRLAVRLPPISAAAFEAMAADLGRGRLVELARAIAADGRQQVDIVPDLHALDMPVQILWGLGDRIIPWTQVARAGARAAIHLIPDAGHMPHWDKPDEVARLLA